MSQETVGLLVPVVAFLLFLSAGVIGMLYPHAIQRYMMSESAAKLNPTLRLEFMKKYVGSKQYVWSLRITGIIGFTGAGVILYSLFGEIVRFFQ